VNPQECFFFFVMWFHSVYKFQKKAQVANDIALLRIHKKIK